jgi:nucleoid DNA-binding protein
MTKQKVRTKIGTVNSDRNIRSIMEKLLIEQALPLCDYDFVSIISEMTKTNRSDVNSLLESIGLICNQQLSQVGEFELHGLASFKIVTIKQRGSKNSGQDASSVPETTAVRVVCAPELKSFTRNRL